ncbi:MAG: hypothetical protein ACYDC1_12020 [Limisphaerales bacterium]
MFSEPPRGVLTGDILFWPSANSLTISGSGEIWTSLPLEVTPESGVSYEVEPNSTFTVEGTTTVNSGGFYAMLKPVTLQNLHADSALQTISQPSSMASLGGSGGFETPLQMSSVPEPGETALVFGLLSGCVVLWIKFGGRS